MSGEANSNAEVFSTLEIDTIGEIMNISMGSAATAASTLLDKKVTITIPTVEVIPISEFDITPLEPAVGVEIKYVEGISGSNILILRHQDVGVILSQMMQMELPENFVIDEMAESAMCELMNQMMGSSATVLSCFLGRTINISTPITVPIGGLDEFKEEHLKNGTHIVTCKFTLSIEDLIDSEFIGVMGVSLAKEIISVSLNFDTNTEEVAAAAPPAPEPVSDPVEGMPPPVVPAPQAPPAPLPAATPAPEMSAFDQQPQGGYPQGAPTQPYPAPPYPQYPQQQPYYPPAPGYGMPPQGYPQQAAAPEAAPVLVKDFEYNDFGNPGDVQETPANIDLVMNVPVVVTVELGRTKRKIKEVLEFGQGSIVELDKQAGSQVDVIVNGQLIAKGDVVVVDDNFSVRITEILKSRDSLTML